MKEDPTVDLKHRTVFMEFTFQKMTMKAEWKILCRRPRVEAEEAIVRGYMGLIVKIAHCADLANNI